MNAISYIDDIGVAVSTYLSVDCPAKISELEVTLYHGGRLMAQRTAWTSTRWSSSYAPQETPFNSMARRLALLQSDH